MIAHLVVAQIKNSEVFQCLDLKGNEGQVEGPEVDPDAPKL